jgi:citrate lyase subunit beta/citryl-CoA lyase
MDADTAVTWLFVPGDRPERFAKAEAAGADSIIIDLQDAVAPSAKNRARRNAIEWFEAGGRGSVRVNPLSSSEGISDVAALGDWHARAHTWGQLPCSITSIMLPLSERVSDLTQIAGALPGVPVVLLVESARGVSALKELCAHPAASRVAFGNLDMSHDVSCREDSPVLDACRSAIVIESRAAGLAAPIDGVTTDIANLEQSTTDARRARRDGFGGKLCIHPTQVPAVATEFAPDPDEVRWAEQVVAAIGSTDAGVVTLDGQMLDAPVLKRAQRILELTGAAS